MSQQVVFVFPQEWAMRLENGTLVMPTELSELVDKESESLSEIELVGVIDGTREEDMVSSHPRVHIDAGGYVVFVIGGMQRLEPGQPIGDDPSPFMAIGNRIAREYKQRYHSSL